MGQDALKMLKTSNLSLPERLLESHAMPTISGYQAYEWQQHALRHHQSNMLVHVYRRYLRGVGERNKMKCKGPGVNFLIVLINNSSRKLLLFTFKIESFKTVADNNKMVQKSSTLYQFC